MKRETVSAIKYYAGTRLAFLYVAVVSTMVMIYGLQFIGVPLRQPLVAYTAQDALLLAGGVVVLFLPSFALGIAISYTFYIVAKAIGAVIP